MRNSLRCCLAVVLLALGLAACRNDRNGQNELKPGYEVVLRQDYGARISNPDGVTVDGVTIPFRGSCVISKTSTIRYVGETHWGLIFLHEGKGNRRSISIRSITHIHNQIPLSAEPHTYKIEYGSCPAGSYVFVLRETIAAIKDWNKYDDQFKKLTSSK